MKSRDQTSDPYAPYDIEYLNKFYEDADSVDQEVFAEQRSNLMLVSGDHYNKRRSSFFRRIRDSRELSQEQKLRITKNHIQKICKIYSNNILSMAPSVGFMPKNEQEIQDQKAAELHKAVWADAEERYNLDDLRDEWCDSFVEIGEVALKIFYDPYGGEILGHTQKVDQNGELVFDEMGAPVPDLEQPKFKGEFIFEEIYGFNLLRSPECKDIRNAEIIGTRKMVSRDILLAKYGKDSDKAKLFAESPDDTYHIFDAYRGGYVKTKGQVMVREYFVRPCARYSQGHFFFTTKEGIFEEGDLPGGIFPIVFQSFETVKTTPRGRSPIKIMRPYQVEINRAASKTAEHQITLGDDKLILSNGAKASSGMTLPGIRTVSITGQSPVVLAGRSGDQYLPYIESQIKELYDVMMVAEDSQEVPGQMDPYTLLFRSAKQKKKFQRNIRRFSSFYIKVVKTYLSLAKIHLSDEAVIYAVGRNEIVNIQEFRAMPDICYQIKIDGKSDDIETQLGKQMSISHVIQYAGSKLDSDSIGKFLKQMPFSNLDASFDDLTIDYDSVRNDMLALDRGERPPVHEFDNHVYCIKNLTLRMRKADFSQLSPEIQANYHDKVMIHQQMEAQNKAQIQMAESGFIPTGGYLVVCDLYVPDPSNPMKTQRVKVPSESLQWMLKKMEIQGSNMTELSKLPQDAQAQIASQMTQGQHQAGPPGLQQPPRMAPNGMGPNQATNGNVMPGRIQNGRISTNLT